jgi:hypothetical protein
MIHYFNPGHETAVLNASKYYQPGANQIKMQQDLAFLPAWYASPDDFVLTDHPLTDEFLDFLSFLNPIAQTLTIPDFARMKNRLQQEKVDLWGISPQSVHLFEKQNQLYDLQLNIPEWKEEYRSLGSRLRSQECLSYLIETIPEIEKEILPVFFSKVEDVENYVSQQTENQLVKAPYSSSGRGLIWLPPTPLARSERQIISGILKKQTKVSVEKALDKQLDFSMHFEINPEEEVHFIGYSVFQTNSKGAYEKSMLANQEILEEPIYAFMDKSLLLRVKDLLTSFIKERYSPYYQGCIGVDMLVYRSKGEFRLNPCVEINLRKSMGYLAIQLNKNHLCPASSGEFRIDYNQNHGAIYRKHKKMQAENPLILDGRKIQSGYLALCPVTEESRYCAYLTSMVHGARCTMRS